MEKSLSQIINETERKIADVINDSHLAPEILELILRNIHSQIVQIILDAPKEDAQNGEQSNRPEGRQES